VITVALVGPDGAGKTTISELVVQELGVPVKRIYMGVNPDAELLLPTTRLLARAAKAQRRRSEGVPRGARPPRDLPLLARLRSSVRAGARVAVWMSEEWARQAAAWYHRARGHVVLFDRHFYADYLEPADPPAGARPLSDRIHLFLLEHVYPKPDLVIFLDAPAEVLHERKPEAPLEWLRQRRLVYLELGDRVRRFEVVDATRPKGEVARDVASRILRAREERGRTPRNEEGSQAT
jgi:thymidylate kinase